jgi:tRNA1(Val) A37 N6-methylase TrmN6
MEYIQRIHKGDDMTNKTHKKHGLNAEVLKSLYCEGLLSDREIGLKYDLTGEGVAYYRKKYGIKTITARQRISLKAAKNGMKDINSVSIEEFQDMYNKYSERVLAEMFGCSKMLINTKIKEFKIKPLSKTERRAISLPSKLTPAQHSIIYGSLLGDGGISEPKGIVETARFYESHAESQKDYIAWKHRMLKPFSTEDTGSYIKTLPDGRECNLITMRTYFHKIFFEFREMFYGGEKRHLPESFADDIDALALAVWYMDDGSNNGYKFTLASAFSDEDINTIINVLESKFGIQSTKNSDDRSVTIISIINGDAFFKLIKPHLHSSMNYKVPVKLRFAEYDENHWISPNEFDLKEYSESTEEGKQEIVNQLIKYYYTVGFPYSKITAAKRRRKLKFLIESDVDLDHPISLGFTQCSDLCLSFMKNIWTAKRAGRKSPIEVFNDKEMLSHAISDCIKYKGKISDSILRSELKTFGGVDNFRPSIAKAIYDRYCPEGGSILDPCSGYSGRLMGFYASHARSYCGVDANPDTVKNLKHLKRIVSRDIEDKEVSIFYSAFEDIDLSMQKQVDLVFTSPPYFGKELYCDDPKQSHVRYDNYSFWLSCFLKPMIDKSFALLKSGGYFIINIDDISIDGVMYTAASDFVKMVQDNYSETLSYETKHEMTLGSMYGKDRGSESIFVFKKV